MYVKFISIYLYTYVHVRYVIFHVFALFEILELILMYIVHVGIHLSPEYKQKILFFMSMNKRVHTYNLTIMMQTLKISRKLYIQLNAS